jgi:osmotically-inducible protein OsmY
MTMWRDDARIQQDVLAELDLDAATAHLEIGVAVRSGVVTLSGAVDRVEERDAVVEAARRVIGVKAIAEEIRIKGRGVNRTDTELAHAVVQALQWDRAVPPGITARVDEGWVWLDGFVDTRPQLIAAERAVRFVTGVRGVTNGLLIRSH